MVLWIKYFPHLIYKLDCLVYIRITPPKANPFFFSKSHVYFKKTSLLCDWSKSVIQTYLFSGYMNPPPFPIFFFYIMGNDGGSIPRRIELVKEKAKDLKLNPELERAAAWLYCALSKVKKKCYHCLDLNLIHLSASFGTTRCIL